MTIKCTTPKLNSYEFSNYSLDARDAFVKQLRRLGFDDDFITTRLDGLDSSIRQVGAGAVILGNPYVTPPVLVTVRTPAPARR